MEIAVVFFAVIFVFCMAFLGGAVGRLLAEFAVGASSKAKPLAAPAAICLRVLGWLAGSIGGGVIAWQRFWTGMWNDGSKIMMPNVPDQPVWFGAVVVGLVLFWLSSWMARKRHSKASPESA
jgi:hypothetical protein